MANKANVEMAKELYSAVVEKNLERVRYLLTSGVSPNCLICGPTGFEHRDADSFLHHTTDEKIAKELIKHGANVNSANKYGDRPLRYAVINRRQEIVKTLLKHGALVNIRDRHGNTPLNNIIRQKSASPEIILSLLNYDADIHYSNKDGYSPLENAIHEPKIAQLLLKWEVFKRNGIKVAKCIQSKEELLLYWSACISERESLKTEKVNHVMTLFGFLSSKNENLLALCAKSTEIVEYFKSDDFKNKYPISWDLLWEKMEIGLERNELLAKLDMLKMHSFRNTDGKSEGSRTLADIVLNCDCKRSIASYLSNENLRNLISAAENSREDTEMPQNPFKKIKI